jgi:hypothetical protein
LPEILREVKNIETEAKAIKKEILQLCWYMRGLSYTEGMNLSHDERSIISDIVKEHMEITKKSGLPFF